MAPGARGASCVRGPGLWELPFPGALSVARALPVTTALPSMGWGGGSKHGAHFSLVDVPARTPGRLLALSWKTVCISTCKSLSF